MSTLVESLKRLYTGGKLTEAKLKDMLNKKKITAAEYNYITKRGD